jgi:hypothetical protein
MMSFLALFCFCFGLLPMGRCHFFVSSCTCSLTFLAAAGLPDEGGKRDAPPRNVPPARVLDSIYGSTASKLMEKMGWKVTPSLVIGTCIDCIVTRAVGLAQQSKVILTLGRQQVRASPSCPRRGLLHSFRPISCLCVDMPISGSRPSFITSGLGFTKRKRSDLSDQKLEQLEVVSRSNLAYWSL